MEKFIERRKANGQLLILQTPEFGTIVKDGKIVNQEAWNILQERKKQASQAPAKPQQVNTPKPQENASEERLDALESKVDKLTSLLEKLVDEKD